MAKFGIGIPTFNRWDLLEISLENPETCSLTFYTEAKGVALFRFRFLGICEIKG